MKRIIMIVLAAVLVVTGVFALCACAEEGQSQTPPEVVTSEGDAEPVEPDDAEPQARADGERFEGTVLIEGSEESVMCEHKIGSFGYEIDFYYEQFEFSTGEGMDCYQWKNDDMNEMPKNIITISHAGNEAASLANSIADSMRENGFATVEVNSGELAGMAAYVVSSSGYSGDLYGSDAIINTYVIPIDAENSLFVETQFTVESEEGVGARMLGMLSTIKLVTES